MTLSTRRASASLPCVRLILAVVFVVAALAGRQALLVEPAAVSSEPATEPPTQPATRLRTGSGVSASVQPFVPDAGSDASDGCPDAPAALSAEEAARVPFLAFDPPSPKMGLTNQLICVAAALHLALVSGRALVLPKESTPPLEALIDFAAVARRFPCAVRLRVFPHSAVTHTDARGKKFPRFVLPSRPDAARHPLLHARRLRALLLRHNATRGLRAPSLLWHVPFTGPPPTGLDAPHESEHFLLRALAASFVEVPVRRDAARVLEMLHSGGSGFVGLHLRLESDATAIQLSRPLSKPSAARLATFVRTCVIGSVRRHAGRVEAGNGSSAAGAATARAWPDTLYVAAGALSPEYVAALRGLPFRRVVFRSDVGVAADTWRSPNGHTTNHFDAAKDALVLAAARVAISADFSTLARLVQVQRCPVGASVLTDAAAVYTYDPNFTAMTPRPCFDARTGEENGSLATGAARSGPLLSSMAFTSMGNYESLLRGSVCGEAPRV